MSKTNSRAKELKESVALLQDPKAPIDTDLLHKSLKYLLNAREYTEFEALGQRARNNNAKTASAIFDSHRNRYLLDKAALAGGWQEEERPKFWWMRGPFPGNFGDILTPFLIWNLFKIPVRWAPCAKSDCLAIGSIAKCATPGIKMWGPGIANPDHVIEPKADWLAVRGPETQKALRKAGAKVPDVTGDPALLLPRAYQPKVKKTGYGLIIPHYTHVSWFQKSLKIHTELEAEQVKILSPIVNGFEGIRDFIDQTASADWVIASSLHGLIVAHAYGVKCCWVMPERSAPKGPNDSIKYTDYMSSVGLPTNLVVLRDQVNLADVIDQAREAAKLPDLDALEAAFPFKGLTPSSPLPKPDLNSIFTSDRTNNIRLTIIQKPSMSEEKEPQPEPKSSTKHDAKKAARVQARKDAKLAKSKPAKTESKPTKSERKEAKVAARKASKAQSKEVRILERKAIHLERKEAKALEGKARKEARIKAKKKKD